MDEVLLRQLTRQLKLLNFWITSVGVLLFAAIAVCIFMLIKVLTFVNHTESQISNLQNKTEQSLNIKQKVCGNSSIANYLQGKTDACQ